MSFGNLCGYSIITIISLERVKHEYALTILFKSKYFEMAKSNQDYGSDIFEKKMGGNLYSGYVFSKSTPRIFGLGK